jgi:low temperature requirement protein LtrA
MALHTRLIARDPTEQHRASTPLELFFDLTFAVAVSQAAASLQRGLEAGHPGRTLLGFALVFFGIWWAWMNFSWFASAYDNDDVFYRIAVLVQMTGVLILAAGVPRAIADRDFAVMTLGYVVIRLALVPLWLRAAGAHPEGRRCALRYVAGISIVQAAWVGRLALPGDAGLVGFFVLAGAELCVPLWAEAAGRTPWHPSHIAERYGLFTIIVLGESILAATTGVQRALDGHSSFGHLAPVVVGGLLIVFSMWWIYFDMPIDRIVEHSRRAFTQRLSGAFAWGYGHYLVFAGAAAVGTGLTVAVDQADHHTHLTDFAAGWVITGPVALYVLVVWGLHFRFKPPSAVRNFAVPVGAALVLGASATPQPVLLSGIVMALLVAVGVAEREHQQKDERPAPSAPQ